MLNRINKYPSQVSNEHAHGIHTFLNEHAHGVHTFLNEHTHGVHTFLNEYAPEYTLFSTTRRDNGIIFEEGDLKQNPKSHFVDHI